MPNDRENVTTARYLRRNLTDAERRLWSRLRNRQICGCKFRRQHSIGPFVADFACAETKLVIEVDGGQHSEQTKNSDIQRTAFLNNDGWQVLRFWNNDVLSNTEGVLQVIVAAIRNTSE